MSPPDDRARRTGAALLPVVATLFTLALVTATLASTHRAGTRAARAAAARGTVEPVADAARDSVVRRVRAGRLPALAAADTVVVVARADTLARAVVSRPAWDHLVVRIDVAHGAGMRAWTAGAHRRLDLPLDVPLPMPPGPLAGAAMWEHAGAVLLGLDDDGADVRRCRDTLPAAPVAAVHRAPPPPVAALLGHPALHPLDPDTLVAPVHGVVRLAGGVVLARPLAVDGILVADGDLAIEAPLHVRGVIVAAGSVDTRARGVLRLDGAVWAGDAGGGRSRLRSGDTVRWDPCAVRAARARLARPAPIEAWEVARGR